MELGSYTIAYNKLETKPGTKGSSNCSSEETQEPMANRVLSGKFQF